MMQRRWCVDDLFCAASNSVNQHLAWTDDLFRVLSLHPAVAITERFQIAASFLHVLAPDVSQPFKAVIMGNSRFHVMASRSSNGVVSVGVCKPSDPFTMRM